MAQPLRWLAPESHQSNSPKYDFKTDAWSYGITVWEMYSRGTASLNGRPHTMHYCNSCLVSYIVFQYVSMIAKRITFVMVNPIRSVVIYQRKRQADFSDDQSGSVCGVQHSRPLDPAQAPAVGVCVTGMPFAWLHSYPTGRTQFVKMGQHVSPTVYLQVGVPQRSPWTSAVRRLLQSCR